MRQVSPKQALEELPVVRNLEVQEFMDDYEVPEPARLAG